MSDYTPSSLFKHSLVLTTAIAVVTVAGSAEAYSRRNQLPSIEVRLEVLESLRRQAEMEAQQRAAQPAPHHAAPHTAPHQQVVPQDMPFGRPSAPLTQPQVRTQQPAAPAPQAAPAPSAPPAQAKPPAAYQPAAPAPAAPAPTPAPKPEPKKPEPKPEPVKAAPPPLPFDDEPLPLPAEDEFPAMPEPPAASDELPPPPLFPDMEEMDDEAELTPLDIPDMPPPRKRDDMPELDEMPPLPAMDDEADERVAPPPPPPLFDEELQADEVDDAEDSLAPLPVLEGMDDADAQGVPAVSAPVDEFDEFADPAPRPQQEQGMFAGLVSQVKSMLGMGDKPAAGRSALVADDMDDIDNLPLPAGAAPMGQSDMQQPLPDFVDDAATMDGAAMDEAVMDDMPPPPAGLPPLPRSSAKSAADEAEDELPGLPPLPTENVGEVPVATAPNRSLPSLNAIVSEDRREQMATADMPEFDALPELDDLPPPPSREAAAPAPASVAAAENDLMSLDEMPPMPDFLDAEEAEPAEMDVASLPAPPAPPAPAGAASQDDAPAAAGRAPEVTNKGKPNQRVRLFYGRDDTDVSPEMEAALRDVADALKADSSLRLTMRSYAGSDPDQDVPAKRISLKRALAIRTHLIEAGVAADRIAPPKALGNEVEGGPNERVDIQFEKRG